VFGDGETPETAKKLGLPRGRDAARTVLGDTAFAATRAEGRAMTLEQAIEYALAV